VQIRDRIRELRRVPASSLVPNPKNWRRHSESQLTAIKGVLSEIGFAGAELARELPDGTLELIDGHARATVAGDAVVPVLILDVTEEEADKLLLTYDPLSAMATTDEIALQELIKLSEFDNAELQHLMDSLTIDDLQSEQPTEDAVNPAMELRPHEHYDFIIVLASDAMEWNKLCEKLGITQQPLFGKKKTKYGISRAIKAERVLALLQNDNPVPKAD
jgi:hypothetical protein